MTIHKETYRVLDRLLKLEMITRSSHELLQDFIEKWHASEFDAVLETKTLTETKLTDFLAEDCEISRLQKVNIDDIDLNLLKKLPFRLAKELECLILAEDENDDQKIKILCSNPTNSALKKVLSDLFGQDGFKLCIAERCEVIKAVHNFYPATLQIDFNTLSDHG